ncbi:MarR family transcriptional regulator [Herbiconiux sp.]|uniref:MarR family winged helix-turn-helix transcriptional regulator n=1 Tax=Herbiconiux sp. TaxID=1871186 RepID=UPI0025B9DC0E|nr:MarR family transcriptional regulator [Herbiconiux sp.]
MTQPATTASLTGDELETWAGLATVLEWLPAALDAPLERDFGLTHFEYGILYALANAPDHALRMTVLAGYANSSLSRLSRAATRLEARALLERSRDPDDGRSTRAALTAAGLEAYAAATPGHVATVTRLVLDPLTAAQKRQLREITRRLQGAIRTDGAWQPPPSPVREA